MSVPACVHVNACASVRVSLPVCVNASVHDCGYVCQCACQDLSACVSVCMCINACVCLCSSVNACVCASMNVHLYLGQCMCQYVCMCFNVRVSVCASMRWGGMWSACTLPHFYVCVNTGGELVCGYTIMVLFVCLWLCVFVVCLHVGMVWECVLRRGECACVKVHVCVQALPGGFSVGLCCAFTCVSGRGMGPGQIPRLASLLPSHTRAQNGGFVAPHLRNNARGQGIKTLPPPTFSAAAPTPFIKVAPLLGFWFICNPACHIPNRHSKAYAMQLSARLHAGQGGWQRHVPALLGTMGAECPDVHGTCWAWLTLGLCREWRMGPGRRRWGGASPWCMGTNTTREWGLGHGWTSNSRHLRT
uniref:Uncharacterized protein n=1 Tax=Pelusios castaneus TaxID=367368 RepID=A0A8C8SWC3_9SAUR